MQRSVEVELNELQCVSIEEVKLPDQNSLSVDSGTSSATLTSSNFPTPRGSRSDMNRADQQTFHAQATTGNNTASMIRKATDGNSGRSVHTPFGSVTSVPEMSEEEKSEIVKRNLTVMFSCIYAVLLAMFGGVVYVSHQSPQNSYIGDIFSSVVALVGTAWLMFFHVDLFRYKSSVLKRMVQKNDEQSDRISTITDFHLSLVLGEINPPYRFLQGRHSGSFYLKIGLAAFCFGHLINEGLQLGQGILNYAEEKRNALDCGDMASVVLHVIRPLYSFYQLFIIFKYSNIIINRYKEVARFALMHIMATCLCFWFSTIVEDALEDYHHKLEEMYDEHSDNVTQDKITNCNITRCYCTSGAILSVNNLQAIPYLYPFTVEFNLLLAGVWFIVWQNIGKDHLHANPHHFRHKINNTDGTDEITFQSNLVISADCHASNKGLFAGLFLMMTCIISVIVFFVAMTSKEYVSLGATINTSQEAVLTALSLIGVLLAYRQLSKLDFCLHPITFLDDVLLFIPLPFYFVQAILSVMAELNGGDVIRVVMCIAVPLQVILQTPFIIDGLRRCSNSQNLRYQKPGREVVTFLIICNLTMWIVNTFEAKSVEPYYAQSSYFGELIWMFIAHTTLPLMLFYRFHSSVCLADIWKSAYGKEE